jgi:hypothetical protein
MATGTVPKGTAPDNSQVPQHVETGGMGASPVPSKPSNITGPGGPSVSIPKVGKDGK